MHVNDEKTCPFKDVNGLTAIFLDDVADRPVPQGSEARLAEIRQAIDEGTATVDMALEIIDLFP